MLGALLNLIPSEELSIGAGRGAGLRLWLTSKLVASSYVKAWCSDYERHFTTVLRRMRGFLLSE